MFMATIPVIPHNYIYQQQYRHTPLMVTTEQYIGYDQTELGMFMAMIPVIPHVYVDNNTDIHSLQHCISVENKILQSSQHCFRSDENSCYVSSTLSRGMVGYSCYVSSPLSRGIVGHSCYVSSPLSRGMVGGV